MKGGGSAARSKDDDEIAAQLRAGGCPEEEIAKLRGGSEEVEEFEAWEENVDAIRAFWFCTTQWRSVVVPAGMAAGVVVWQGLDYAAVKVAFEVHPPKDLADAWWALRVIEAEAVRLRNQDGHQ